MRERIRFWFRDVSYIYMLYCPDTGLTKVGITDNVDRRTKEIIRDCAFDIELLAVWHVPAHLARGFETAVHLAFEYCRHHGEWFKLTDDERNELASMRQITMSAWQHRPAILKNMPKNAFNTALMAI